MVFDGAAAGGAAAAAAPEFEAVVRRSGHKRNILVFHNSHECQSQSAKVLALPHAHQDKFKKYTPQPGGCHVKKLIGLTFGCFRLVSFAKINLLWK